VLLENRTHWHLGILGGILEGFFDNIFRKPSKVGAQLSEILLVFDDLMLMGLVQPWKIRDNVVIQN
jgi:hypothetical protein